MKYPQQTLIPPDYLRKKIDEFIVEDAPDGDLTTRGILAEGIVITARIEAEDSLVFAGEQLIAPFFDPPVDVKVNSRDGQKVNKGALVAEIRGAADTILMRERVLLNLLQHLCGIATETRRCVEIAEPYGVRILDTRKTTPGLRVFEKYAVAVAGGFNHRLNLSTGILIKDNHIKAAGSITMALNKIRAKAYALPIEVEVENLTEIDEAIACNVKAMLLDNMSPVETRRAVEHIRRKAGGKDVFIEASGGITLATIAAYVDTGIDAVSIGSLTHSVRSAALHMEFYPA